MLHFSFEAVSLAFIGQLELLIGRWALKPLASRVWNSSGIHPYQLTKGVLGVTPPTRLTLCELFRHCQTDYLKIKFSEDLQSVQKLISVSVGRRRRPVGLHSPSGCRARNLDMLQCRVVRWLLRMRDKRVQTPIMPFECQIPLCLNQRQQLPVGGAPRR